MSQTMGLRITILDSATEQRLKVEGELAGPSVTELESAWNQVRQKEPSRRVVVDLIDVRCIDSRGKATLTAMIPGGAQLSAKGVYWEYVVEKLVKGARKEPARRRRRNRSAATGTQASADEHIQGMQKFTDEGDALR